MIFNVHQDDCWFVHTTNLHHIFPNQVTLHHIFPNQVTAFAAQTYTLEINT